MNRLTIKNWFRKWSVVFQDGANHTVAVNFKKRHPQLFRFFLLRFDPHHFRGLPFTLLLLGVVLNMFILSEVAEEVREASHLRDADRFIAAYLYNIRNETTAEWIYLFTRMGSSPMVLFLSSVLTLALFYKRRFSAWIALFSALIASSISAYAGKVYYKLPRPHDLAWYEEFSYSFPSGHATIAMAFYGILFYFLVLYVKNTKLKLSFAFIGFIFILSMGFSRVYLGVHYLSDVISGFLIGFVWFLFSVTLLGWLDFRNEHRRQN